MKVNRVQKVTQQKLSYDSSESIVWKPIIGRNYKKKRVQSNDHNLSKPPQNKTKSSTNQTVSPLKYSTCNDGFMKLYNRTESESPTSSRHQSTNRGWSRTEALRKICPHSRCKIGTHCGGSLEMKVKATGKRILRRRKSSKKSLEHFPTPKWVCFLKILFSSGLACKYAGIFLLLVIVIDYRVKLVLLHIWQNEPLNFFS